MEKEHKTTNERRMLDLSDRLKELRDEKDVLEETLKDLKTRIDAVEYDLSEQMALDETQSFTRAGTTFYLSTKSYASAVAENKAELHAALKENGYAELVYETVNANSLSSFVREVREENNDSLPDWLDGLVNVYDKTTVGLRKARK
ncbi:MAG: hypothetical protein LBK46_03505 [Oscillospiraceae bacterium]|jgi:chromosome segregation ATPase|nr:hypothetical protein [Oscillospiraceae bacterium]